MSLIELYNIEKSYKCGDNRIKALKNINLLINSGELIAIVGASGSGKSTLLNIIGCLDVATSGNYNFKDKDISSYKAPKLRNKVFGYVVQNFALINDYSIYDNISLPLVYSKISRSERKTKINNILKKFNITNKIDSTPPELSGGQNQRVAIARAVVNDPEIILADEPTGALDTKNSNMVMDLLLDLNKEGKTIILVTHNLDLANKCHRIITLKDGQIISDKRNI